MCVCGGKLDPPEIRSHGAEVGTTWLVNKQPMFSVAGAQDWTRRRMEGFFLPGPWLVPLGTTLEITVFTYLGIPERQRFRYSGVTIFGHYLRT